MKRILLTALILVTSCTTRCDNKKIRLYCMYTPSHEVLYKEWFLPTLQDDYEIVASRFDQKCAQGSFLTPGWAKTILHKIDVILGAIEENWGGIFVFSDVDIQFFAPTWPTLSRMIEDHDIVMQRSFLAAKDKRVNTGFFACRANERSRTTWQAAKEIVLKKIANEEEIGDQLAFNTILTRNPAKLRVAFLPPTFLKPWGRERETWKPGKALHIPKDVVMHHACRTKNFEDKILQLQYVRRTVEGRMPKL